MLEEHPRLGKPLCAGGFHVVLAEFFEEDGPVESYSSAYGAYDAYHDRENEEFKRVDAHVVAGHWKKPQEFSEEVLPAYYVEKGRDRHHYDAKHDPHASRYVPRMKATSMEKTRLASIPIVNVGSATAKLGHILRDISSFMFTFSLSELPKSNQRSGTDFWNKMVWVIFLTPVSSLFIANGRS